MILTRRPYSASLLGLSPLHKCPKLEPSLYKYIYIYVPPGLYPSLASKIGFPLAVRG
jgi:hypothetical protein